MQEKDLQALFEQMTIEEKLGQMTQTTGEFFVGDEFSDELVETGPSMEDLGFDEESVHTIGSVLGVSGAKAINAVQAAYLAKSRLKIPLMFMHDAIHGYRTIFPIPLALASSFDREAARKVGELTATELRAGGIQVDFSPMTDLVRDARWGRVMESFGEDAVVSGELGAAMTQGYQGAENGRIAENGVVACLKHFAAYGAPDAGRDYASVDMSAKEFFGFYAKTYELALASHPRMVMSSFNSLNGEPATASKWLLQDILREKFGYEDLIISDWGAVSELKNHGVAADDKAAGELALLAGVDIEMVSNTYLKYGAELAEKSPEIAAQIDRASWQILQLKNELGLFEQPYADERKEATTIRSDELVSNAKELAKSSCVLLKNEQNILPLTMEENLLIIGPFAKTQELLGNWNCKGRFVETVSVEQGFRALSKNVYAYETLETVPLDLLKATEKVIVTIGESWEKSGEGHSSSNLELSESQQILIHTLKAQGKKLIALGFAGRPLVLESVISDLDALLWTWYLGNEAGLAIAELVLGLDSPTGRLPMSFPRVSTQVPLRYNELRSGRPANETSYSSRYQDLEVGPLFPFGYGLRYGTVKMEDLTISSAVITDENPVSISLTLTNESPYDTAETVILYMEDPVSKLVRPIRELLDFKRISLKKGETKSAQFLVSTNDLSYVNNQAEKALETGTIRFYVNDLTTVIGEIEVV